MIRFAGQALLTARFLVQWTASEIKEQSPISTAFWWLSLAGSLALLGYAIHRRGPVFILGHCFTMVVYSRNLVFIQRRGADRTAPARS